MKALLLEGDGVLNLREIEDPIPDNRSILVTVEATGIGGSEYLSFKNTGIRPLPNIMGHGISGVTPDGQRVSIYPLSSCGKCPYCLEGQEQLCDNWSLIGVQSNGGFAQKVSVPHHQLFKIPNDLSWAQSVFIEPFANSVNAWEQSCAHKDSKVCVIGGGSLGLGLVACANTSGNEVTDVLEKSVSRQAAALRL